MVSSGRVYMNTLLGIAMSPPSQHRVLAISVWRPVVPIAILLALCLAIGAVAAASVNPEQPLQIDGLEIYFGFIPAEILRGHPIEHAEQTMHGGVPLGKGVRHLIVTVFDAKTRARITNATVTAGVKEAGAANQNQKLESMLFGAAVGYGNFFSMPNEGPYEVVVNVSLPGTGRTVTARFQYRNLR